MAEPTTNLREGGRGLSLALCAVFLALVSLVVFQGVASADHPNDTAVTAALGEKPPELEGVTVQVRDTQGPQLVVENDTDETLEIHDGEGVPFLRIGPEGVEANRKAKTFYETYGPEGIPVAEEARKATIEEASDSPEWTRISDQKSWGWFDHRLETDGLDVPEEVSHAEETTEFGEWEIPVRLGDDGASLRGRYRYEPPPQGAYVSSITSEPEALEVVAQLSQGYGGPGAILLRNEGEEPLTVLDGDGEPAIEIGPDEVRVNVSSPVGREASRGVAGEAGGDTAQPQWKTVAGGSSFTWQDPRLRPPEGHTHSNINERHEVARWEIPLESSGERHMLEGVIEWEPLEDETGPSDHDHSDHDHSDHDHSDHDHSEVGVSSRGEGGSGPEDSGGVDRGGLRTATVAPAAVVIVALLGGGLAYRRLRSRR